jgi:hypothetical protein
VERRLALCHVYSEVFFSFVTCFWWFCLELNGLFLTHSYILVPCAIEVVPGQFFTLQIVIVT